MITKIVLLAAVVLCGVSAIQPGCRTRYELRMKWAVEETGTRYWECARWGKAVQFSCPIGTLFSAPYQTCVPSKVWEDFPYYAPPTTTTDFEDECKEETGVECVDKCIDVECEGGVVVDHKCECYDNWFVENGVCVNPKERCVGGWVISGECVCPEGWSLVDGVCRNPVEWCVGGQIIDGQCVCFGDAHLNDKGVCIPGPGEVDDCGEHGSWDAVENRCVCNDGAQFINGMCVAASGICDGAPDSAYVRGTMDCNAPACTDDQYWANIHWPTRNPRTFWQCPGIAWVQEMPCGAGTCFSYKHQVCIHARDWVNECN